MTNTPDPTTAPPSAETGTAELRALREAIATLTQKVATLEMAMGAEDERQGNKVILAASTDTGWKQQLPHTDALVEFVGGLVGAAASDAPIGLAGAMALLLVRDTDGGRQRYVRVSGSDVFPAILGAPIAANSNGYEWVEASQTTAGAFSSLAGGRTDEAHVYAAWEPNSFLGLANGTVVHLKENRDYVTGKRAYSIIREVIAITGSPTDLSDTGTSANATTWAYKTVHPASLPIVSRLKYVSADDKLYAYTRTAIIDANGNVTAISAEVRTTVFTTSPTCE